MKTKTVFSFRNCALLLILVAALFFVFRPSQAYNTLFLSEHWTQVHDGTAGRAYNAPIYLSTGKEASFSLSKGTLPPGLYLYGYEKGRAAISGTPTAAGTYTFTIRAVDASNYSGEFDFTIRIANYNSTYTCYVKDGDPLTPDGLVGTYFHPGDIVQLSWYKHAPAGYCLDKYECAIDLDLNPNYTFYMPAQNVSVTTKFKRINQGSFELDVANYSLPGADAPINWTDEIVENTIRAAMDEGDIWVDINEQDSSKPWYATNTEYWYIDLDKNRTFDMVLTRMESSDGSVDRIIATHQDSSIEDYATITLPDDVIANSPVSVYKSIKFFVGHHLKAVGFMYPTCVTPGLRSHYVCTGCGKRFWDPYCENQIIDIEDVIIGSTGHSMSVVAGKEATCMEGGTKDHYGCSECHEWFWDEWGNKPISNHMDAVTMPTGHDLEHINGSKPTCTENGVIEHYVCKNCQKWFWENSAKMLIANHDDVILPAGGHSMTLVEGVPATCTEAGTKEYYVCDICHNLYLDAEGTSPIAKQEDTVIPAKGHSFIQISGKIPTCEDSGVVEHYICSECGKWFWDAEATKPVTNPADAVLAAVGHNWGEWKTVKEPTATESGLAERYCLNDVNHKESMVLPPVGGTVPAEETTTMEPIPATVVPPETTDVPPTVEPTQPEPTTAAPTTPVPSQTEPPATSQPAESTAAPQASSSAPASTESDTKDGKSGGSILPWILLPVMLGAGVGGGLLIAAKGKKK